MIHRGDDLVDDFGLGTDAYWQDGDFEIGRKVVTPYYGHTAGMPWNDAGAMLTWRSYIWASGVGG